MWRSGARQHCSVPEQSRGPHFPVVHHGRRSAPGRRLRCLPNRRCDPGNGGPITLETSLEWETSHRRVASTGLARHLPELTIAGARQIGCVWVIWPVKGSDRPAHSPQCIDVFGSLNKARLALALEGLGYCSSKAEPLVHSRLPVLRQPPRDCAVVPSEDDRSGSHAYRAFAQCDPAFSKQAWTKGWHMPTDEALQYALMSSQERMAPESVPDRRADVLLQSDPRAHPASGRVPE